MAFIAADKLTIDIYQSNFFVQIINQSPWLVLFKVYLFNCTTKIFIIDLNMNKLFTLNGIKTINGDFFRINRTLFDVSTFAIWCGSEMIDIESCPDKIPNIERVGFTKVSSNNILLFIRLENVIILFEGKYFKHGDFDLQ